MNSLTKDNHRKRTELLLAVAFTGLLFVLSWSDVVYIPVSETRLIDLSLVPVVFAAMIGGYTFAIPIAIGWWLSASMNQLGVQYDTEWILATKVIFTISLVYFYNFFKRVYHQSPWNVHRTIIVAVFAKNIVTSTGVIFMYSEMPIQIWFKDTLVEFAIEMAICMLAMSLLLEQLRKIHVLNGIRRKQKITN